MQFVQQALQIALFFGMLYHRTILYVAQSGQIIFQIMPQIVQHDTKMDNFSFATSLVNSDTTQ